MKKSYLYLNIEFLQTQVPHLPFHVYILNSDKTVLSLFLLSFNPLLPIHFEKAKELTQKEYTLCIETNQKLVLKNFLLQNNITDSSRGYIQVNMNRLQIGEQVVFTGSENKVSTNRFAAEKISTILKADVSETTNSKNLMKSNITSPDTNKSANLIYEGSDSLNKDNKAKKVSKKSSSQLDQSKHNELQEKQKHEVTKEDETESIVHKDLEIVDNPHKDLASHEKNQLQINNDTRISFLMNEIKAEVELFPQNHSYSVSLAKKLIHHYLNDQSLPNMLVLLCYYACKAQKKSTLEDYADIICAAFLCQIGQTQLKRTIITKPYQSLSFNDHKLYSRYPGLTGHILKKTKIQLSPRCSKIIEQHQERIDGSGFPYQKMEAQIELLAQTLGLSLQVLEYSRGDINGRPYDLFHLLEKVKERKEFTDFKLNFSEQVLVLISQIKTMFEIQEEKSEFQKEMVS